MLCSFSLNSHCTCCQTPCVYVTLSGNIFLFTLVYVCLAQTRKHKFWLKALPYVIQGCWTEFNPARMLERYLYLQQRWTLYYLFPVSKMISKVNHQNPSPFKPLHLCAVIVTVSRLTVCTHINLDIITLNILWLGSTAGMRDSVLPSLSLLLTSSSLSLALASWQAQTFSKDTIFCLSVGRGHPHIETLW